MKLFQTKAYKVLMNYVYGWGASAVIIGALFKIMHFPGAGIILTIGMLVEAFIFFLSAFEPALEHYDWSRVFPALSSKEIEQGDNVPVQMPVGMTGNPVQTVRSTVSGKIDLGLEAEDLDKLKTGIHKIAETADNFAGIVGNAPEVAQKIAKASASFEELGERTSQVSKALEECCPWYFVQLRGNQQYAAGFCSVSDPADERKLRETIHGNGKFGRTFF